MNDAPKAKVFISYAREDYPVAQCLFQRLQAAGAEPWLDRLNLQPGANWKREIGSAIRQSEFVVMLLSSHSVGKRGYVQKEALEAIAVMEELPEGSIFLIPARIDECEPSHERLRDLHRVDLFPSFDQGLEAILATIANRPSSASRFGGNQPLPTSPGRPDATSRESTSSIPNPASPKSAFPLEPAPSSSGRPLAVWSVVGLAAFFIATGCFFTYRGLPSPFPLRLVEKIAEDKTLDPWRQRNKTLLPGLVITALAASLAHHFGFRCATGRPTEPPSRRMSLPFGLSGVVPASDRRWTYWAFIALFHAVPLVVTAYLASEFFDHPNLYYRDDRNQQVWVTFFSAEAWNFTGLFHRRPILWSNDIELQRGIYPLFLLLLLAFHAWICLRFVHALFRQRNQMPSPSVAADPMSR